MAEEKERRNEPEIKLCTSFFKDSGNITTKEIYTEKWVEVINTLERRKSVSLCKNQ